MWTRAWRVASSGPELARRTERAAAIKSMEPWPAVDGAAGVGLGDVAEDQKGAGAMLGEAEEGVRGEGAASHQR
jgi:hypothetical protein